MAKFQIQISAFFEKEVEANSPDEALKIAHEELPRLQMAMEKGELLDAEVTGVLKLS